ncbi:MAG: phosphoribosyl-AMP cyclohydrolase [Spirochaetia bacterium]
MEKIDFEKTGGLIPAVVQDHRTGEVLMLAFMNRDALELTRKTGFAHYFSRSRQQIWKKGETSGHLQEVKELFTDCDRDTILLKVRQEGDTACHTGKRSCFHIELSLFDTETKKTGP